MSADVVCDVRYWKKNRPVMITGGAPVPESKRPEKSAMKSVRPEKLAADDEDDEGAE